jgi:hypothetical protein
MRLTIKLKHGKSWVDASDEFPPFDKITPEEILQLDGKACVIEYKSPRGRSFYAVGELAMLEGAWAKEKDAVSMQVMRDYWAIEMRNFGLSADDQAANAEERRKICEAEGVAPSEIEAILSSHPDLYGSK